MFYILSFSLTLLLLLAGCGGGGAGRTTMRPMDPPPVQQPDPPPQVGQQTAFGTGGNRPQFSPLQSSPALRGRLQQSNPVFGSVAGSLYVGLAPVRTIDTTFTGDRFTFSVQRQDGSGFTLDTNRHYTEVVNDSSVSSNPVTNRPFTQGYVVSGSGASLTGAGGMIEWANTDFTDYLAGGYWIHVEPSGVEMGAFIDGVDYPTPRAADYTLPVTGTATYRGFAGGLYVAAGGTDSLSPGSAEFGEYQGRARLTADFGTMQMSGRVDQTQIFNVVGQHANGVPYVNPGPQASDVEMVFRPVPINQNGTFFGDNVTFTSQDYAITSSSGSWAGQFSTVEDARGNPRAAAGTNTGYLETAGGSRAFLTGAFYGATERFE